MNEETKEVIRDIYEMIRTNDSDFVQYGVCHRIVEMYPDAFDGALKGSPYASIPAVDVDGIRKLKGQLMSNKIINCNYCGKQQIVVVPHTLRDQLNKLIKENEDI